MTINELFDKYDIKYKRLGAEKGMTLFRIGDMNVMFWMNEGNAFKMKRKWFDALEKDCDRYALFLLDKKTKTYYYLKFLNKNNWLSGSFKGCDKPELFLGKQVLNNTSTLGKIITDLSKIGK